MTTEAQQRQAERDFITDLVLLKARAGRLGLWKTMHALEEATQFVGWEVADAHQAR